MTREDLKEIILSVIDKMERVSPRPACAFLWSDYDLGTVYTTVYGVGEESEPPSTTLYAVGEEDPDSYPDPN